MSGVLAFPIGRALSTWTFDPLIVIGLVAAAIVYERGRRRIRARTGKDRVVTSGGVACFWLGLACIAFSLMSPVGALDDVLFSMHMTQHLILGLVAPLFLVLGRPITVWSWALRDSPRRTLDRRRRELLPPARFRRSAPWIGLGALAFHVGAWWVWHIPVMFDAAVAHEPIHDLEHLCLFLAGIPLWWVTTGVRWRERVGLGIGYLFLATLGTGLLAGLLVLADHPLYTVSPELASWHVNPMSDQQIGGAIMWVPGGIIYLTAASVLLIRWLERGPARTRSVGVSTP